MTYKSREAFEAWWKREWVRWSSADEFIEQVAWNAWTERGRADEWNMAIEAAAPFDSAYRMNLPLKPAGLSQLRDYLPGVLTWGDFEKLIMAIRSLEAKAETK